MTAGEPRLSCTVLLVRDRGGLEVLMVERHQKAHFASALVFPGGLVDPEDGDAAWLELIDGAEVLSPYDRAIRMAGYRELYEETGVLLAEADGRPVRAPPAPSHHFIDTVRDAGARLDLAAMHSFAHWIAPERATRRYDTHFLICGIDTDHVAVSDGRETVSAEWIQPQAALDQAAAGARKLVFPTRMNLGLLARSATAGEAIAAARARRIVTVMPRVERRGGAEVVVLPPDAGYGIVVEPATVIV